MIDATSVYCRQLEDELESRRGRGRWPRAWPRKRRAIEGVDLAVCPPSCYLEAVGRAIAGSKVALGPRTCITKRNGAFTGELSAAMLRDLGCNYVILGHSERRHILGETDAAVNKKVLAALAAGLMPIVCVGELLAEREAGQTLAVIRRQFDGSLAGLSPEQIENDRHRLRAGLGDRHRQGGHPPTGGGSPSRPSQDRGRAL